MGFTITWDDQNSRPNIIEGVSNTGGGDQAGLISNATGYDESTPPIFPPIDNEEFDNEELAPRWKFFGNLTEGGVARGASFTSPLNSAKYSLTNRRGFFQLQPVADPLTTDGQGIYAELDDGSKNAGNAPTNWKMSAGLFVEIDTSTLPSGDVDSVLLVGLFDKALDGTADVTKFVGAFVGTNFSTPDTPLTIAAAKIVPPDDLEAFGTPLRLPALPISSKIKIHKIGTTYRIYAVIDGRHTELGSATIASLNPVIFGYQHVNGDTPNAISMVDYFRHEFTATDAE